MPLNDFSNPNAANLHDIVPVAVLTLGADASAKVKLFAVGTVQIFASTLYSDCVAPEILIT